MKRGEIYYISHRNTIGSEIAKGRPAIIVSNDALNATSDVIEVVFLTTQPKKELPCHVSINATGITSTALCEQVTTVSKTLVGDYFGRCTEGEMAEIGLAMIRSLGLIGLFSYTCEDTEPVRADEQRRVQECDAVNHPSHYTDGRIEVIDYIEDKELGYHLGNAVKYISRAGKKDPAKYIEDLKKAVWYLNREIGRETKEGEG